MGSSVEKHDDDWGRILEDDQKERMSDAEIEALMRDAQVHPIEEAASNPLSIAVTNRVRGRVAATKKAKRTKHKGDEAYSPRFARSLERMGASADDWGQEETRAEEAAQALAHALAARGFDAGSSSISLTVNGVYAVCSHKGELTREDVLAIREELLDKMGASIRYAKTQPGKFGALLSDADQNRVPLPLAWERRPQVARRRDGLHLSAVIGIDEPEGNDCSIDLRSMAPHALIVGESGSGKTTLIRTMLLDLAATNPSSRLEFCLIDPKHDLGRGGLSTLPHMAMPIVCDKAAAAALFEWVNGEMLRRYALMAQAGARSLPHYNVMAAPEDRLPELLIVHDDLSEWLADADYAQRVVESAKVLSLKAQAAGICLLFAAKPDEENETLAKIHEYFGHRLVLKRPEEAAEIAVNEDGAEYFFGAGRLSEETFGKVCRCRTIVLSDQEGELAEITDAIKAADADWV